MDKEKSLDYQTFKKLSVIYAIALGSIALFTIGGQFFIQRFLSNQIDDSKIVNISGRQRMLSQKIVKDILFITSIQKEKEEETARYIDDLSLSITLFKDSHEFLKHYADSLYANDIGYKGIHSQFKDLQPHYLKLLRYSSNILDKASNSQQLSVLKNDDLSEIKIAESSFLKKMNEIVFDFDSKAKEKVAELKRIEYALFIIIIIILVLEFLILFRPLAFGVKRTISELIFSKELANQSTKNLEQLRRVQEENIQELLSHVKAIDKTLLYARVDQKGNIIALGERFKKMLEIDQNRLKDNLAKLLNLSELQKSRFQELLLRNNGSILNEEFKYTDPKSNQIKWLDISILSIHRNNANSEKLVLCSDISKRVEAQKEVEQLRESRYKEKEQLQKSNTSLVVEAQEEERKRIAKEIHDSIGQMLTALKFNIESINLENLDKAESKIDGLKKLSKDLIQGIRISTFNLTPPELKDYGITIALKKLAAELTKLIGKQIQFDNQSDFDQRFDTLTETNLYRITQEAVNNAIKYAKSDRILIRVNHSNEILSITVEDNGKGFDTNKIPEKPENNAEGGMGLFFMRERTNYINGRIFIDSTPGSGTKVTLNYPLIDKKI